MRNKIEIKHKAQKRLDEAEAANDLDAIREAAEAARDAGVADAQLSRAEMHIATLEQTASLMGDLASALLSEDVAIIEHALEAAEQVYRYLPRNTNRTPTNHTPTTHQPHTNHAAITHQPSTNRP